jgi:hypothetical protein
MLPSGYESDDFIQLALDRGQRRAAVKTSMCPRAANTTDNYQFLRKDSAPSGCPQQPPSPLLARSVVMLQQCDQNGKRQGEGHGETE